MFPLSTRWYLPAASRSFLLSCAVLASLAAQGAANVHGGMQMPDKPQMFPDMSGIASMFDNFKEQALTLKGPSFLGKGQTSSAQSEGTSSAAAAYAQLTAEDVRKRVADATSSTWGQLVIGPNDKGVCIWRRAVAGSKWEEVRGSAILKASPASVSALFETDGVELIRSFNPLYDTGYDIEKFSECAKAAYSRVKSVFPGLKPRDTVTAVEQHEVPAELGRGTVFVLRSMLHPAVPVFPNCVRAEIISGMNLVQPVEGEPGQCRFTFTQHGDPGGAIPAWIINKLVSREAVQFVARIETAAKKIG